MKKRNYTNIILGLFSTVLLMLTFTVNAAELDPINESADDDIVLLTDGATLFCYTAAVELGLELTPYCASLGWTIPILESGTPTKFGNILVAVAFEKDRLILGPCQVNPTICTPSHGE